MKAAVSKNHVEHDLDMALSLKAGWQAVPMGEICTLFNGRAYSKDELLADGPTPVLRVGNFFTNRNWYYSDLELDENKYCDTGDLLYAWSASFGPRIWEGGRVIYHYHIWKMAPDTERLDRDYLFHFLDWDVENIKAAQGAGTTMLHVTKGSMEARLVPLPPLEEQRRIVAVLDEAFAGIATATANAQKNLTNARALFEGYSSSLFEELVASGAPLTALDELTASGSGITYGVVKPGDEGDVPFVRGGDLINGEVRLSQLRTITSEVSAQYRRTLLRGGELLICLVGVPGQCAVATSELAGANIARQVGLIRLKEGVDALFVKDFLQSPVGQKALGTFTGGSVQQVINLGDLKQVKVPVLTKEQQRTFVERLGKAKAHANRLEASYRTKLVVLAELKQSLLQKAFAGELTR